MMKEKTHASLSYMAVTPLPAPTKTLPSQALAQQRFNQAIELEKQLWNLLQTKGPLDSHAQDLRSSIRDCYAFIVLEDHDFAETHDVEQALWRLHYKQIEEFRARIRRSAAAGASARQVWMPGTKSVHGTKPNVSRREPLQKVLGVFKCFLSEATGFYHELIVKLRSKCGLPQDYFSYEDSMTICGEIKSAEILKFQLTCHRCLIFLGDLARYKEYHGDGDARSRDWSVSANYYLKAISIYSSGGNPHNQLAVLATYVSDDLLAVYHYFRSLAVDNPFLTARENLILLFEKNRQQYAHISSCTNEANLPVSGFEVTKVVEKVKTGDKMLPLGNGLLKLAVKEYREQSPESKGMPGFISELRKDFQVRFIRLNGILFTRTSLETFPDVYSAASNDWEQLLSQDDSTFEVGWVSENRGGIGTGTSAATGVVQHVAILIFTVHNVYNAAQSSYLDVLQHSTLLRYAFTAAFEFAAQIMRRCVDTKDASQSPLLPAILVFMEWLACRPEIALRIEGDADEKQESARSSFWKQCMSLLNGFPDFDKGNDLDGSLEVSFKMNSVDNIREGEYGFALWEDYELQGFVPLAPAQRTLDYAKRPSRILPGDKRQQQIRIKRLIAAGKAISNALEGSGKGISFNEDTCKFFLTGELMVKAKSVCSENVNWCSIPAHGSVSEDYTGSKLPINIRKEIHGLSISREPRKQLFPETLSVKQTDGDEEEVIVFQPLLKEGSSYSSLASTKSMENKIEIPGHSFGPLKSSSIGNDHELDASKKYVQNASRNLQLPHNNAAVTHTEFEKELLGCFQASSIPHVPSSLNGVSHLVSKPPSSSGTLCKSLDLGMNNVNYVNFTGTLHNDSTGLGSVQDWLNCTKAALSSTDMPHGNWFLKYNDRTLIDGLPKSPGIIGQVKSANTNDLLWGAAPSNCFNSFPDTTLSGTGDTHISSWNPVTHVPITGSSYVNGLPEISVSNVLNPHDGVVNNPTSSMPMVVMTGTNVVSSRKERSAEEHSKAVTGTEGNILNLEQGCFNVGPTASIGNNSIWVTEENPSSSWFSPVIRPPPGFGPLQRKFPMTVAEPPPSSQCEVENLNMMDMEEHIQIDDYSWLDDFKPLKSDPSKSRWEDAAPIYDSCIKSSSSMGLEFGTIAFSGMRPSQEQQKQNVAFQLRQQPFLQQSQNGGLGLHQQPHLYGMRHLSDSQDQAYAEQLLLHHHHHQQQQLWYGYNTKGRFVS